MRVRHVVVIGHPEDFEERVNETLIQLEEDFEIVEIQYATTPLAPSGAIFSALICYR